MDRIPLPVLAKELGLRPAFALKLAQSAGLNIARYSATLTPGQAERVRARLQADTAAQVQRTKRYEESARRAAEASAAMDAIPDKDERSAGGAVAVQEQREAVGPPNPCECCGIEVTPLAWAVDSGSRHCSRCVSHSEVPGESDARRLDRLTEHSFRLRDAYAEDWRRSEGLRTEVRRYRRSRNSWRGALVEVMVVHEESPAGCKCGAKTFPCATWIALEEANRGVTKQVDRFLTLNDGERDAELYPSDHWDITDDAPDDAGPSSLL